MARQGSPSVPGWCSGGHRAGGDSGGDRGTGAVAGELRPCTAVLVNRTSAAPQAQLYIIHQPAAWLCSAAIVTEFFLCRQLVQLPSARPASGSLGKGSGGSGMGQSDPAGDSVGPEGPEMPDSGFLHRPRSLLG